MDWKKLIGWDSEVTPESYPTPLEMVQEYYTQAGITLEPMLAVSLFMEEQEEWQEAAISFDLAAIFFGPPYSPEEELKELADVVYTAYGYALANGWNLDEALSRVHQNNLGRMYQEDGSIKRNAEGKIMKNKSYPKVNLGDLV
jgi:hypothetical protein